MQTLSGWTERFREAAHGVGGALQDSLDIRYVDKRCVESERVMTLILAGTWVEH